MPSGSDSATQWGPEKGLRASPWGPREASRVYLRGENTEEEGAG